MESTIEKQPYTYAILLITMYFLMLLHLFDIVQLKTDKFAFFLVSLIFVLLLLPYLKYIKFFDLIELRKEVKALKEEMAKVSGFSSRKR